VTLPTTLFSGAGNSGAGEELGAGWELDGGGCEPVEPDDEEVGCELVLLGVVDDVPPDEPALELDAAGALAVVVRGAGAAAEERLGGMGTGGAAAGFVGSGVLAASNCAGNGSGDAAPSGSGAGGAAGGGATAP
jgi:hypothetical protein